MADVDYARIRPRRGTAQEWTLFNPVLAEGEIAIEYPDTGIGTGEIKVKVGDGSTPWNDLNYSINPTVANAIYGGTPEISNDICIRAGTTQQWLLVDPVLGDNEIAYDKTYLSFKMGDGSHKFSELPYIRASALVTDQLDIDGGDEDEDVPPTPPTPSEDSIWMDTDNHQLYYEDETAGWINLSINHVHNIDDITDIGSIAAKNTISITDIDATNGIDFGCE